MNMGQVTATKIDTFIIMGEVFQENLVGNFVKVSRPPVSQGLAQSRDWTSDLQIFSLTLSQLSYLGYKKKLRSV